MLDVVQISSWHAMPRLILQQPHRVSFPSLQHPRVQPKPVRALDPINPTMSPKTKPTQAKLQTVHAMLNAGGPRLLQPSPSSLP
jgi:hypothetical protein